MREDELLSLRRRKFIFTTEAGMNCRFIRI